MTGQGDVFSYLFLSFQKRKNMSTAIHYPERVSHLSLNCNFTLEHVIMPNARNHDVPGKICLKAYLSIKQASTGGDRSLTAINLPELCPDFSNVTGDCGRADGPEQRSELSGTMDTVYP